MVVTGSTNSFWDTTNSFGTKHNNVETYFHYVVPDSHFFGSRDQIIAFVNYMHINKTTKKDLLITLENTKKNGYDLLKISGVEVLPPTPKYTQILSEGLNEKEIEDLIKLNKELLNFKLNK